MKRIHCITAIFIAGLLLVLSSCASPDSGRDPVGVQTEAGTVAEVETKADLSTETTEETQASSETQPSAPVTYGFFYGPNQEEVKQTYQSLCIGPDEESSDPSLGGTYEVSMCLSSPVIYAQTNQTFAIPLLTSSENYEFYQTEFEVTWRIAEEELLEVVSVNPQGFVAGTRQLYATGSDFFVRSIAPGTVHLYITVADAESGVYQTMQQIIVIEE